MTTFWPAATYSGVKLLGIMYAECDKLNKTAELLILDEFNALTCYVA